MWKWTCPKQENIVYEHHSWASLNEFLTAHEDGLTGDGFADIPPCLDEHDYWDDGEPCQTPKCRIRYVRNDELTDVDLATINQLLG